MSSERPRVLRRRRADQLLEVVQRLSFCRRNDEVIAVLRAAARGLTGADGVAVVLREGESCYYADEDAIGPLWKGRRFPMEACISGWAMLNRSTAVIEDIYGDPRIPHDAYRPTFVRSLAMVPIRPEDPLGALGAYWGTKHAATEREVSAMQRLADAAALAFTNVRLIEQLEAGNRRRDHFISMLGHELRNPIAPIRNGLQLMKLRGCDDPLIGKVRDMMERQVEQLARLVDDLLEASRVSTGKVAVRRERVDLAQLVAELAGDYHGVLAQAGVALTLDVPAHPIWIDADRARLSQVLGNVLDNARKFTARGGSVNIALRADEADASAELAIRDNGIGMTPETAATVFEAFTQADHSLEHAAGGLGLGLAVAKGLVELHGGTIEAASAGIGRGSTFRIRLPMQPEAPALAQRRATTIRRAKRAIRVLVVEDNADAAESLRLLLQECGYEVSVAADGAAAVALAKRVSPHVVLCDIGLPGATGFKVAQALRQEPRTAKAFIAAVTGYGGEGIAARCREAGFDAHLTKPVDPEELLSRLP